MAATSPIISCPGIRGKPVGIAWNFTASSLHAGQESFTRSIGIVEHSPGANTASKNFDDDLAVLRFMPWYDCTLQFAADSFEAVCHESFGMGHVLMVVRWVDRERGCGERKPSMNDLL